MKKNKKLISILLLLLTLLSFNINVEASDCPHTTTERVKYKAPTCTEPGYIAHRVCLLNDCILNSNYEVIDINDVIIPPLGHTEITLPGYEPTCIDDGLSEGKKCTVCGVVTVTQEVVPASGHKEITETSIIENATCVTDGKKLVVTYCDVCKKELKKETVTVPAVGEHQYIEEVEGTRIPSTCDIQGSVNMKCVCGDIITVSINIDENAHSWSEWTIKTAPTCISAGEETRVCVYNPSHIERREISIKTDAHSWGEWIVKTTPTCISAGEEIRVCAYNPSHIERREISIKTDAHSWGEWIVKTTPTCTSAGEETRVCAYNSSHIEHREISIKADAHGWGDWKVKITPTCTSAGEETRVCAYNSSHIEKREVPVKSDAHSWGAWTVTKTPTCTLKGEEMRVCNYNSAHRQIRSVDENPDAHTLKSRTENEIAPSCGADGSYSFVVYCDDCGKEISRETVAVPATGNHSYITEVENSRVDPTCVREGSVVMRCVCGDTNTVILPVNEDAHKWSASGTITVAPTCVSQGKITYKCENYGCLSVDTRMVGVDANAHKWNNGTLTQKATCISEGTIEYCCEYSSLHKRTEKTPLDKNVHKPLTETRNYVAETCGKNGYYDTVTFCDDCKAVLKTVANTIPATGEHNYTEEVLSSKVPPTCISDGSVIMKCICGAEKIHKLSKDANAHIPDSEGYDCILCGKELRCRHSWTDSKVVTKESSCIENGSKAIICTKCNEPKSGTVETIPAYGHDFVNEWKTLSEATCQAQGIKIRVCRNCYDVETKTTAKLSHTDKDKDYICDICSTVTDIAALKGEKTESTDSVATPCSCNCHKTGISKILFTITNFFEKLFGNNKVCSCGVKH